MAHTILTRLADEGVPSLLIKGPSFEQWLYADGRRAYGDLDVVVEPRRFAAAERVLSTLGFVNRYDGGAPGWADEHADPWTSDRWLLPIDLHRRIWGIDGQPAEVWRWLWEGHVRITTLEGRPIPIPSEPARAALVALHAAHHRTASQPLEDLRRAIDVVDDTVWSTAADELRALGGLPGFLAGLELLPAGQALRARLHLEHEPASLPGVRYRSVDAPPTVEGFMRMGDLPTVRDKARFLLRELFPSQQFMRERSIVGPLARRGRAGMITGYVVRLAQLARHARTGYRAARSAERTADPPTRGHDETR